MATMETKTLHLQYQIEEQKLGLTKELKGNDKLLRLIVEDTESRLTWCAGYVISKSGLYDKDLVIPMPLEYRGDLDIDWQKDQLTKLVGKDQKIDAVIRKRVAPVQSTFSMWGESVYSESLKEIETVIGWRVTNAKK